MISDNNHIIYSAEDIQRYWKGQLSPQEMHAMEKAALDDPFLADAMEGMGLALQEHDEKILNTQLAEMQQHIEARATGTVQTAPVRSFRWWQVAAAAFVLIAAGYWIFSSGSLNKDVLATKEDESQGGFFPPAVQKQDSVAPASADKAVDALGSDSLVATYEVNANRVKEPGLHEFQTTAPNKEKDNTLYFSPSSPDIASVTPSGLENTKKKAAEFKDVRRQNAPATSNTDTARKMETEVITVQQPVAVREKVDDKLAGKEPKLQNVISGVVTDNRNNPLPNVFIRLYNNQKSYMTDPAGNFRIPAADSVINVSVSLQGYATQNFQLRSTFNNAGLLADNQIRLQTTDELAANQNAYRKMVEAKKGKQYDTEVSEYKITDQDAQPINGWLSYDQYLEKNKRIPASNPNLTGEVAVSFQINKKGERTAYEIEKTLSAAHDAEAIRLVREGPPWKLTKGRRSRITVIVRF